MSNRKTIVSIIGTRPEAIKMAPVVRELERHPAKFQSIVVCTEQHRELLGQAMAASRNCDSRPPSHQHAGGRPTGRDADAGSSRRDRRAATGR